MKSLKNVLELNVLIEMAVGDCEFKQLLMRDPLLAVQEYNRQRNREAGSDCVLPRPEVEMLRSVAGVTTDFRQFCRMLLDERDRMEREEQRRQLELVGAGSPTGKHQVEKLPARRTA